MLIMLKVHVQTLHHLGIVTFNSSSVALYRTIYSFSHVGVLLYEKEALGQDQTQPMTPADVLLQHLLHFSGNWKRPPEWPRNSWLSVVSKDMKGVGIPDAIVWSWRKISDVLEERCCWTCR